MAVLSVGEVLQCYANISFWTAVEYVVGSVFHKRKWRLNESLALGGRGDEGKSIDSNGNNNNNDGVDSNLSNSHKNNDAGYNELKSHSNICNNKYNSVDNVSKTRW